MKHMNVQAEVRRILAEALSPVTVAVHVPADRPAELVTVQRKGGAAQRYVYEDSTIEVQCWAASEARAEELMESVRQALSDLTYADGFLPVTEQVIRTDYDLVAHSPRWYGRFQLTTYQPSNS